jgi:hypothetical protein
MGKCIILLSLLFFSISSIGAEIFAITAFTPENLSQLLEASKASGTEIKLPSGASRAIRRAVADHNAEVRASQANNRAAKLKAMSPAERAVQPYLRDPEVAMWVYEDFVKKEAAKKTPAKGNPKPTAKTNLKTSTARVGGAAATTAVVGVGVGGKAFLLTPKVAATIGTLGTILGAAAVGQIIHDAAEACEGVKCFRDYADHRRRIKMDQIAVSRSGVKKPEPRLNEFVLECDTDKCLEKLINTYYFPGSNEDPDVKFARVSSSWKKKMEDAGPILISAGDMLRNLGNMNGPEILKKTKFNPREEAPRQLRDYGGAEG